MKIIVDIDQTICSFTNGDYEQAEPLIENIKIINELYNDHEIIYWTARGTETGIDWRKITEKQFKEWGVKYHELKFGKPNALFIDDKSLHPDELKSFDINLKILNKIKGI